MSVDDFPSPAPVCRRAACLAVLALSLLPGGVTEAAAAAAPPASLASPRVYAIGAGALSDVLAQFAAQAGVALSFDAAQLAGMASPGLHGSYGVRAGFEALLRGSGFELDVRGNGYSLRRSDGRAVRELSAVQVLGDRDPADEVYRAAGSTHYVSREHIERFRGTSVGDIFQGIPGVLVGENRNSGGLDVNIRGMQGQGRVPVLIDGARQETTVYRGYSGVASRSYVDPDLIGGIQIDKGPTMAAAGTGAVGGLVSMSTLTADDVIPAGEELGVRLRGSLIGNNSGSAPAPGTYAGYYTEGTAYRSNCRFASDCEDARYQMPDSFAPAHGMNRPGLLQPRSGAGSIAVAKRFRSADVVAAYAQRSQGNYYAGTHGPAPTIAKDGPNNVIWWDETRVSVDGASRFRAGERVPNTNYASRSFLLKGRLYDIGDHELDVGYLRYDSDFGEMMPSQIAGFGPSRQWLDSHVATNTYTAKWRWAPSGSGWLDLRTNLWHTATKSDINTPDIYSIDIADNTHRTETYDRWGIDTANTFRAPWLGGMKLDLGAAAQLEKMRTRTDNTGGFYGGSRAGKRSEASMFAAFEWTPVESVTLNAGIRRTWFRSEDDNALAISEDSAFCKDADGDGQCDPVYYKNRKHGSAPMFSVAWRPLDGLQLYARYAEALRMPSLFETTSGWSVSPALDIDLRPEHAKNKEVGASYLKDGWLSGSDKLRLRVAYFRNHIDDYLTRTPPNLWEDGNLGNPWAYDFFRMRNIQSAAFHGVEVSGSYDMGSVFMEFGATRYHHIELCHVGSYRRYFCTDYGVPQSYINNMIPPKWHASLMLGARLLDRKLVVGARGTFMGKRNRVPRYNNDAGFTAPVQWHAYTLLDVFASYRVDKRLSIDFNIDNLTDRYYLDALSLGLVPAPGRTVRMSATWQF